MTDLRDHLDRIAGPYAPPTPTQVDADLSRGHRALQRRRTRRTFAGSALAVASILVAVPIATAGDGGGGSSAANRQAVVVRPTLPKVVAYTGKQPNTFVVSKVPKNWKVYPRHDLDHSLTIQDPNGYNYYGGDAPPGHPGTSRSGVPVVPSGEPDGVPVVPSGEPDGVPVVPSGEPDGVPIVPSGEPDGVPDGLTGVHEPPSDQPIGRIDVVRMSKDSAKAPEGKRVIVDGRKGVLVRTPNFRDDVAGQVYRVDGFRLFEQAALESWAIPVTEPNWQLWVPQKSGGHLVFQFVDVDLTQDQMVEMGAAVRVRPAKR